MHKWRVGWGTSHDCNLACKFCYSNTVRLKKESVGYDEWIKFIDNNHNYIDSINYGTCENTLALDWFKLIKYIRDKYPQVKQALTTNGYLIEQVNKDRMLYDIAIRSLDEIDVSLDFCDEEKYCDFRGNKHVFKWAHGTLQFCREHGIPATIVFLGSAPILEEKNIDGLFHTAKNYDAKLRMNIYRPTNPRKEINDMFIVSYDKLINTLYYINNHYKILLLSDPLFSSILTRGHREIDFSGKSSIRILHNGNITPSTYLITENFQKCNIVEKEILEKIWKEKIFSELNVIPKECAGCSFCETCKGGVYDRRYLWNNTFMLRDPYCPFNEGNFLPEKKIDIYEDKSFESIHNGYLPTIFFSN